MTMVAPERRARSLSGIPPVIDPSLSRRQRLLRNRWLWIGVALALFSAAALWHMYLLVHPDRVVEGVGTVPGLNNDALLQAFRFAWPTAVVWLLVFLALDRFRSVGWTLRWFAFVWGACIATWISMHVNTWAGELLSVTGADPSAGARPAVFVAPFVEEAAKATVLFWLAIGVRYRIVSILQSVSLAGFSAIGFAFVENILYYSRAIVYSASTIQAGDADAAVRELVLLRGVYTSFGHPLFTFTTGVGLAIGLRTRSKLVRILAPLTGFTLACLGHMVFNAVASSGGSRLNFIMALLLVLGVVLFLVRKVFTEKRRIQDRLVDFVQMGWLRERDVINFSSAWRRAWLLIVAARRGLVTLRATRQQLHSITELVYLRDGIVRGIIGESGVDRGRELLDDITGLRGLALDEASGLALAIPWRRLAFWRRSRPSGSDQWAQPVGTGSWGAPVAASWEPPTGGPTRSG